MARCRSGRRSSGVVWRPGSSSASTAGDGANKSTFEEYLMSLRLSERCHKVSIWYAESMKNSDSSYEAWYKKLMDGCPEKYFDVDSIAALHFNNRGEAYPRNIYNTKSFEETIMSEPLRSRCPKVSTWLAESMKDSDSSYYQAQLKKLMVGCPEKYFNVD